MRALATTLLIGTAVLALWAQPPPEDGNASKAKGKGKGAVEGKAKGKGDAKATAPPAPPVIPQVLRLVRPSTYLVTGHGANSIFRVTAKGVILVDTKLPGPGDYERLTELIRGITMEPVRFVFNTRAKSESSGNNSKFQAAGAELVISEQTIKLDVAEARAIRFGETSAIYFPGDKLICVGDLYASNNPASLDALLKLDWAVAVPATGEPVYRRDFEALRKTLP